MLARLSLPALLVLWSLQTAHAAQDTAGNPLSRIAFGSCVHQEKPQPIWDAIADLKPDLFLMIGDNIYGDTKDMEVLKAKYQKLGSNAGFQKVRSMCPILATWDDHDFGTNDGGNDYPFRDESQQIFLDFFGVPKSDPMRSQKGIFHSRIFGPADKSVQVIMLDTRYHRSPLRKKSKSVPGEGPYEASFDRTTTFLGEEQWKWLAEELKKPARLRIVVSSIQVLSNDHGWEKWGLFPHERERLFKLLQDTKAEGVIFLSGDRHHAELSVADIGVSYPIFDVTSSGLNQGFKKWRMPEANSTRVATMFSGNNFGDILIDWDQPNPTVRIQIRDEAGEVTIQEKIGLDLLKPGIMKAQAAPPAIAAGATGKINGEAFDGDKVKDLLNKDVTLECKIVNTGMSATLVFLNSEKDRKSPTNITIVINKKVKEEMKANGIEDPRKHFDGKTVRVEGTLTTFQDRPQIILSEAGKIKLVEKAE